MKLKVLDLFSGIGGFSLGLERSGGFETVAFCEIDKFCQRVLAKHWPGAEIHNDVTRLKYRKNVDLVTAGFPCQDISFAGGGAGLTGERSGLFWYIIRALCMVGWPDVLLENVAALLDRGLGSILGALATVGYDTEWNCISAEAVGAPHERDRLWILGYANHNGRHRAKDTESHPERNDRDAAGAREACKPAGSGDMGQDVFGGTAAAGKVSHPTRQRVQGQRTGGQQEPCSYVIEELLMRCGERPVNADWNVEPAVGRVADGVPDRAHRIKALGNSVVPQIITIIGEAYLRVRGRGL